MLTLLTVPATMAAAEQPTEDCGTVVGPHWTAPGHRSGRNWYVTESGINCDIARYDVKLLLGERVDRHGRLRPPSRGFISCSVDVRHRNIHPYGAGACVGDELGLSWGIYPV